ncbi:hypothetical protein Dimus_009299 [Dionaea muscipula]
MHVKGDLSPESKVPQANISLKRGFVMVFIERNKSIWFSSELERTGSVGYRLLETASIRNPGYGAKRGLQLRSRAHICLVVTGDKCVRPAKQRTSVTWGAEE